MVAALGVCNRGLEEKRLFLLGHIVWEATSYGRFQITDLDTRHLTRSKSAGELADTAVEKALRSKNSRRVGNGLRLLNAQALVHSTGTPRWGQFEKDADLSINLSDRA